ANTNPPKAEKAETETPEQKKARFEAWKAKHNKGGKADVAEAPEPAAERVQAAPKKSQVEAPAGGDNDLLSTGAKTKTEKDFDDRRSGPKSEDKPKQAKAKGSDVYIPPAVSNLPEQLGQGDIMGVVAGHKAQIVGCIQKQKAKDPDSSGVVKMHWVIQKN